MIPHALLLFHVVNATIGLISGVMAMVLRKGGKWHGAAGSVFVVSMLLMSASGAIIAAFYHPIRLNLVAALLTFYLVATAWRAAKLRNGPLGWYDRIALIFILAVSALSLQAGISGATDHMPRPAYFVFGISALICALNDARMLKRGTLTGSKRIARHLWRMSMALLIASLSFYPGRASLFSKALRQSNLLFIPDVLLIGAMVWWMYRVSRRKKQPRDHDSSRYMPANGDILASGRV